MEPEFKIHGQERRALKKEVSLLKRGLSNYWHWWQVNNDMYSCYGLKNPEGKSDAEKHYNRVITDIKEKEKLLAIPYGA